MTQFETIAPLGFYFVGFLVSVFRRIKKELSKVNAGI